MKNVVLAVATAPDGLPVALIVVVAYLCVSTVKVVVNDPDVASAVTCLILILAPNLTVTVSFAP